MFDVKRFSDIPDAVAAYHNNTIKEERLMKRLVSINVNGQARNDAIADNLLLIDYLRESLNLTGTKQGCDGGECGACTVLVDGVPRLACATLAASIEGSQSAPAPARKERRCIARVCAC